MMMVVTRIIVDVGCCLPLHPLELERGRHQPEPESTRDRCSREGAHDKGLRGGQRLLELRATVPKRKADLLCT